MGSGPKTHMSSNREEWYKYRSIDTCIIMSWLVNHESRWPVGNGPKINLLNMRQWSHKEIEGGIPKPVVQTVSQTKFVWSYYVDQKKLGQMGSI